MLFSFVLRLVLPFAPGLQQPSTSPPVAENQHTIVGPPDMEGRSSSSLQFRVLQLINAVLTIKIQNPTVALA